MKAPSRSSSQIDIGGKTETISVDRLKPAHVDLEQPAQVAMPRPRGRPPKNPKPSPTSMTQHQTLDTPNALQPQHTRSGEWCSRRDIRTTLRLVYGEPYDLGV